MKPCQVCVKPIRRGILCMDCRAKGYRNVEGKIVLHQRRAPDTSGDQELASPEVLVRTPSGSQVKMRELVAIRAGYEILEIA